MNAVRSALIFFSNNPDNPIRYPFIEDFCGLDSELYEYESLEVLANGVSASARFAIDSFLFGVSEDSSGVFSSYSIL